MTKTDTPIDHVTDNKELEHTALPEQVHTRETQGT